MALKKVPRAPAYLCPPGLCSLDMHALRPQAVRQVPQPAGITHVISTARGIILLLLVGALSHSNFSFAAGAIVCGGNYTGDTTGAVHIVGTDSGEH